MFQKFLYTIFLDEGKSYLEASGNNIVSLKCCAIITGNSCFTRKNTSLEMFIILA